MACDSLPPALLAAYGADQDFDSESDGEDGPLSDEEEDDDQGMAYGGAHGGAHGRAHGRARKLARLGLAAFADGFEGAAAFGDGAGFGLAEDPGMDSRGSEDESPTDPAFLAEMASVEELVRQAALENLRSAEKAPKPDPKGAGEVGGGPPGSLRGGSCGSPNSGGSANSGVTDDSEDRPGN